MLENIDDKFGALFSVKEILEKIGQKEGSISLLVKVKTTEWANLNQLGWPNIDSPMIAKYLDYLDKEKFFHINPK